ncbi:hypothetical protein JCM3765_000301 [Sporobolomyces pararoseus]
MSQIASPRPIRPTLRLSQFVSRSKSDETQLGGLLDQCDGVPSPTSGYFPRRPPHLDLGGLPLYSPSSVSSFPPCFCSSRPPSPSFASSSSFNCELCNPYPSPRSPLSPVSPTFSDWTTSSSTSSSGRPLSPHEVDDPSILFEFFSIVERTTSSPSSSVSPSRSTSPLSQSVGTPILSTPLLFPNTTSSECISTPKIASPKNREKDGKLKWRNWLSRGTKTSNFELDKASLPPSRTLTKNPFARRLNTFDSL